MSKSVSGQDVEDMLSSVRRLVSSELPRNRRPSLPEGPEALVLTDAQRIKPSMIGHNAPPKTLEDRIAELEAAVSETADDWEPDGSEDQTQHRPDRIVYKPLEDERGGNRRRSLRLSEIALIETGPANEDEAESALLFAAAATFRHESDAGELPPAEEADSSEEVGAEIAAELSDDPDAVVDAPPPEEPHVEDVFFDESVPEDANVADAVADEPVVLSAADLASDVVPDDEAAEDIATDEAFEEALADAVAASLPEAAAEEIERQDDAVSAERVKELYGEPDAEFDDAALRPLVAALIREELQGELGERITRNVRKLVRQEIQRALTVRELE